MTSPLPNQSTGSTGQDSPEILLAILTDLSTDHRCYKLATTLREAGYRPVICCDQPLHPPGPAWDGFDIRVLTRRSHLQGFLPAFVTWMFRSLPLLWRTPARVWISLDAPPLFWLALWGRLRGRMVVYDSHELFLETPMVRSRATRRLFWTAWENAGFALIRKAVTVSPAILERLQARHPRVRFHLLPNMPLQARGGGGEPSPESPRPGEPVKLVYQGSLREASGLPELFVVMSSHPGLTLDVYGGGVAEASLREKALASGAGDRIVFHGTVPFEALPSKMSAAHIGIHLVQPVCESFALTLSNKIFDYVQVGIPVLFSDNPAHRALLAEESVGVAADAFSPDDIARALRQLIGNHETHSAACRVARTRWHWDAYARGLPAFLNS